MVVSRQSHTKHLAKARYEDTAAVLFSWYNGKTSRNIDEVKKRFARVNLMHRAVRSKISTSEESIEDVLDVEKIMRDLTSQERVLLEDIQTLKLQSQNTSVDFLNYSTDFTYFSQMDLSLAQYAFFGNILLFPSEYGLSSMKERDLQNFLHVWRILPSFLGLTDRFSLVLDSLDSTRKLASMALEQVIKPSLLNFGPVNLHMVKMGIPGMDPIVTILGVFSMVGFNLPNVWSTFSWYQKLLYHCRYKIFPKHLNDTL